MRPLGTSLKVGRLGTNPQYAFLVCKAYYAICEVVRAVKQRSNSVPEVKKNYKNISALRLAETRGFRASANHINATSMFWRAAGT